MLWQYTIFLTECQRNYPNSYKIFTAKVRAVTTSAAEAA